METRPLCVAGSSQPTVRTTTSYGVRRRVGRYDACVGLSHAPHRGAHGPGGFTREIGDEYSPPRKVHALHDRRTELVACTPYISIAPALVHTLVSSIEDLRATCRMENVSLSRVRVSTGWDAPKSHPYLPDLRRSSIVADRPTECQLREGARPGEGTDRCPPSAISSCN